MNTLKNLIIFFSFIVLGTLFSYKSFAEDYFEPFNHHILGKELTSYTFFKKNNFYEIIAKANNSASGLYIEDEKYLKIFLEEFPVFKWEWQVNSLQSSADIKIKGKDDYAASLQFLFGKKSLIIKPKILAYAWVGNNAPIGSVIKSPRAPDNFRTIILNNSDSPLKKFIKHERDLREDFMLAYGEYPEKELGGFGVFTDNDQTGQNAEAIYRIYHDKM